MLKVKLCLECISSHDALHINTLSVKTCLCAVDYHQLDNHYVLIHNMYIMHTILWCCEGCWHNYSDVSTNCRYSVVVHS